MSTITDEKKQEILDWMIDAVKDLGKNIAYHKIAAWRFIDVDPEAFDLMLDHESKLAWEEVKDMSFAEILAQLIVDVYMSERKVN